jgi:hypothetical protein
MLSFDPSCLLVLIGYMTHLIMLPTCRVNHTHITQWFQELKEILGEQLDMETAEKLRVASQNNLQVAIGMYFDGVMSNTSTSTSSSLKRRHLEDDVSTRNAPLDIRMTTTLPFQTNTSHHDRRYLGECMVVGYLTTRINSDTYNEGDVAHLEVSLRSDTRRRGSNKRRRMNKSDLSKSILNEKCEYIYSCYTV